MYPSNSLFEVMQVAYNIFNISDLERKFINVHNQRQTLISIIEQYSTSNDNFIGIYYTCQDCEITYLTLLHRALMCFSNVCLNNYSKNMSDTSSSKKQTNKKTAKLN